MIEKIGIKNIYNNTSFVYKIHLVHSFAYMRIDVTPHENHNRYVIIVDSQKFFYDWTGKTVDYCEVTELERDRYADTIEHFSRGIVDPVPLAEVSKDKEISFINGIKRTKWLILNGAPCFPIECSENSVKNFKSTLYDNQKIQTVTTLLQEFL